MRVLSMKTPSQWPWAQRWALLAVLGGLALVLTPPNTHADGLPDFTGYTRPGSPPDVERNGKWIPAAAEKNAIGGTIYFRVFDRANGRKGDTWGTGMEDFNSLFNPGQDASGNPSPELDTTARYLYLYQTINDRGSTSSVRSSAVRILVDPAMISSWGFFSAFNEKTKAVRGVGFSSSFTDKKGESAILPIASEPDHQGVVSEGAGRVYRDPASPWEAPRPYGVSPILIANARGIAFGGEDTGRVPDTVILQPMGNWEGAPPVRASVFELNLPGGARAARPAMTEAAFNLPGRPTDFCGPLTRIYYDPRSSRWYPLPPVTAYAPGETLGMPRDATGRMAAAAAETGDQYRQLAALEAVWEDNPLRPRERSTLYGFTTNYPPIYDDGRIRGMPGGGAVPIGATTPAARAALLLIAFQAPAGGAPGGIRLVADGGVPTPVAFAAPAAAAGAAGPGVGALAGPVGAMGGGSMGGGGFGGGGFPGGGGFGGFPGAFGNGGIPGGGSGGGTGGGSGSGSGTGQPSQSTGTTNGTTNGTGTGTTNGTNTATGTGNATPTVNITNTNTMTQSQAQAQAQAQLQLQLQQQQQRQNQHQRGPHGHNVVPEPAAVIPALLGLPILFLLARRRQPLPRPTA